MIRKETDIRIPKFRKKRREMIGTLLSKCGPQVVVLMFTLSLHDPKIETRFDEGLTSV